MVREHMGPEPGRSACPRPLGPVRGCSGLSPGCSGARPRRPAPEHRGDANAALLRHDAVAGDARMLRSGSFAAPWATMILHASSEACRAFARQRAVAIQETGPGSRERAEL